MQYLLQVKLTSILVHQETNLDSCLNYVKLLPSSSTILLIDLDETQLPSHQVEMIAQTVERMSETVPVIGNLAIPSLPWQPEINVFNSLF
jgi:hypothetical protein